MSITIDYCVSEEDRQQARRLFGEIFSQEDFARKFYSVIENRSDVDVVIGRYNGEPVSVAHIIKSEDAVYLYGVGVLSKYRLKGVFRVLITETVRLCNEGGAPIVLVVPQESYHYDIYKKFDIGAEVFKNTYEIVNCGEFEVKPVQDIQLLYKLTVERGKSMFRLPYELFELMIRETEMTVNFIYRNGELCGYAYMQGAEPYEVYCKYCGFYRITGKKRFALAVENGGRLDPIYEGIYLD